MMEALLAGDAVRVLLGRVLRARDGDLGLESGHTIRTQVLQE
jgi:hypothetical protein